MFSNLASTWAFNNVSNSFENVVAAAGPSPNWFYSTWDTRLTSTGSSNANQIRLPLFNGGTYNFVVNWGDGTSDTITVWNQAQATHTYATPGVYNITITGTITGFRFANTGDRLKILSVTKWGPLRFGNQTAVFWGCANLTLDNVSDVPDMTGVTNMSRFFGECTSLRTINRIGEWNVSNVTDMQFLFESSFNFNADLSNWNTSNVTTMYYMFGMDSTKTGNRRGMFNNNGQPGIGNWNTSKVTSTRTMFQNQSFFDHDVGTKVVTVGGTSYIAWDMSANTQMQFMFASVAGPGFFNNGGSTSIRNWNTSNNTSLQNTFAGQIFFNQDVGTKPVTVGSTSYIAWDTSKVTNMQTFISIASSTFGVQGSFNNGGSTSIRNWNTSLVTSLGGAFQSQPFFNQDIGTKVVTVGASTYTAWNIANCTTLNSMLLVDTRFGAQGSFTNGGSTSIRNWNTTRVTSIASLFAGQPLFNVDLTPSTVTVGATTYSAWNLTGNTSTSFTFYQYDNQQPPLFNNGGSTGIGSWNMSNVVAANSMFRNAASFNQPINGWNVSRVTTMDSMFRGARDFNQPIGNWNVSLVTNFGPTGPTGVNSGFMFQKTADDYSSANYDALLIGWASRPVQPNLTLNFGTIKRTSASNAAVTTLTSAPNNWTIIDGGLV